MPAAPFECVVNAGVPLAERRAFEREWSANMYAACAEAGEGITEKADPVLHRL